MRERFGNLFSAEKDTSAAGQVAVCVAVELFFETSGRLPRRQQGESAGKREEDALAQRWDRLLEQGVEESVRERFGNLPSAAMQVLRARLHVAWQWSFFSRPLGDWRQQGDSAGKREEDALAQRWDRLPQQEAEESVRERFGNLFNAEKDTSAAGQVAVCVAVELFLETTGRLPRRQQPGCTLRVSGALFRDHWASATAATGR